MAQINRVNPIVDGVAGNNFGKAVDTLEIIFSPGTTMNLSTYAGGAWPTVINTIEQFGTIEVLGTLGPINAISTGAAATSGVRLMTSGVGVEANLQAAIQALGMISTANYSGGNVGTFVNVNVATSTVAVITF